MKIIIRPNAFAIATTVVMAIQLQLQLQLSFNVRSVQAAMSTNDLANYCKDKYEYLFGIPNNEPLGPCQWYLSAIRATINGSSQHATGKGVEVGIIGLGMDYNHPDVAPNLDLDRSCSFLDDTSPNAKPEEKGYGDCTNSDYNSAIMDYLGYGTHAATTIGGAINGVGIAGVAPDATLVGLKVCSAKQCYPNLVPAALKYAADINLDIVNIDFINSFDNICINHEPGRTFYRELQNAVDYAKQRGVVIIVGSGDYKENIDQPPLSNPECRFVPSEVSGLMTVSSVGQITVNSPNNWVATNSSVGMSSIDVVAPGGSYLGGFNSVVGRIIGGVSPPVDGQYTVYGSLDVLEGNATKYTDYTGVTSMDNPSNSRYVFLEGTDIAAHVTAGVAALIKELSPNWKPDDIIAQIQNSAAFIHCPTRWHRNGEDDKRSNCSRHGHKTSFFGHGLIDALAATTTV